jgi:hypothetical protein
MNQVTNKASGASMKFPADFTRYLKTGGSRTGELPDFPLWFEIWPPEEMDQWNRDYEVQKYAPGFYGFAGDGGGEMYAFGPDGRIYALPFIGMEPKVAKLLAESWSEFEKKILKE